MTHSLPYEVNCSILFTELPLLQRPSAAKAAGFDAVEFWWPFDRAVPLDAEIDQFVATIRDAGVALVGLNFFAADMPAGDRGLVSWPARSAEFVDSVAVVAGIGEQLGCRAFNALYGNRVDDATPAGAGRSGRAESGHGSRRCRRHRRRRADRTGQRRRPVPAAHGGGRRRGVRSGGRRNRPPQPAAATGRRNLGLLLDLYYLAVNGDDVDAAITAFGAGSAHLQIADAPGRNEPGTGDLALARQLDALQTAGYRGWVGLE